MPRRREATILYPVTFPKKYCGRRQHKTGKESSIRKYDYQRKPCESRYCERCVFKHSNMMWFEAIKRDKGFHCTRCIEHRKQHERKDFQENHWYADLRGYNDMNRGAVNDPLSQAGKSQDDLRVCKAFFSTFSR